MAKIPKYQQDKLASSMVGTPGVDTSMSQAFASGAQALNQVGDTLLRIGQIDYQERLREANRIKAEQRAAAKQLQELHVQTVNGARKAKYGVGLNGLSNELRQAHMFDINGAMESWNAKSVELMESQLETIVDPRERLMAQKALQAEQASQTEQFQNFLNGRIPEIGKANFKVIGDGLKISTNDPMLSPEDVRKKVVAFAEDPTVMKSALNVHGPAAPVAIREMQSDAIRNYMSKVAQSGNLDQLNMVIGAFDDLVEGTDTEEFYSRQRQLAREAQRMAERDFQYTASITAIDGLAELNAASQKGELTREMVDEFKTSVQDAKLPPSMGGAAERVWKSFTKGQWDAAAKVVTEQEKTKRITDAQNTQKDLNAKMGAYIGKYKGQFGARKGVSPIQLADLYADVDAAELSGAITSSAANTARTRINLSIKGLDRKDPQGAAHAKKLMADSDGLIRAATKYTNDPILNKEIGVQFHNQFFDLVQSVEQRKGRPTTQAERNRLIRALMPKVLSEAKQKIEEAKANRNAQIKAQLEKGS